MLPNNVRNGAEICLKCGNECALKVDSKLG